ncbi:MAG: nitrate reductase molybdenum cofactor assembly chaperone [Pyrobaculum sp.]
MDLVGVLYIIAARAVDSPTAFLQAREQISTLAEELGLEELKAFLEEAEGVDLESHRVEMFELTPRCPPYAGYYALGEDSRERGLYMYQILTYYKALGFTMDIRRELPDYLPAMLEFLGATTGGREELRREFYRRFIAPWFKKFVECLEKHKSPYRHLARALWAIFKEEFETPPGRSQ